MKQDEHFLVMNKQKYVGVSGSVGGSKHVNFKFLKAFIFNSRIQIKIQIEYKHKVIVLKS